MRLKRILICFLVLVAVVKIADITVKSVFPLKYANMIDQCADRYNLDEELIAGVIYAESGFEAEAHSGKAIGLMQITEDTARWICEKLKIEYTEELLYTPEQNIEMGSYYLSYLIDYYKNTETALAAYNAGMGNVTKWLGDKNYSENGKTLFDIPYGETKRYVQRVKKFTKIYEFLY